MECGERWATVFLDHKFIGYISSIVPIVFCKTVFLKEIENFLEEKVIIINEDDFDSKKWFIDPQRIEKCSLKLMISGMQQFDILDRYGTKFYGLQKDINNFSDGFNI